jgi:hypothetical protein
MNPYASPQSDMESSLERFLRKQETARLWVLVLCAASLFSSVAMVPLIWWYYTPLSAVAFWLTARSFSDWSERRAERKQCTH